MPVTPARRLTHDEVRASWMIDDWWRGRERAGESDGEKAGVKAGETAGKWAEVTAAICGIGGVAAAAFSATKLYKYRELFPRLLSRAS